VKASNTRAPGELGYSVALSADGNALAVGAVGDTSDATGLNGDESNTSDMGAGAVYLFARSGTTWTQADYAKATNTQAEEDFGDAVALSADGGTLAVGAVTIPRQSRGHSEDVSRSKRLWLRCSSRAARRSHRTVAGYLMRRSCSTRSSSFSWCLM